MIKRENIKISLESFDHGVLNKSMLDIITTVKKTGAVIKGPIPLPTKIERFTVIRGPHVDKNSREQFEMRSSKRLLIIFPTQHTVDSLMRLSLSPGVEIKIAINGIKN